MAYITLKELKEILPEILDQWIDEDDESWEWIFQEIEQKCYIGTKCKGKKWKKKITKDIADLTDATYKVHEPKIIQLEKDINELTKMIGELRRYSTDNLSSRINKLSRDIDVAKSMAQTAKQRTDVDYTKCSKEKSDALEKKEIPVVKKTCETCKYAVLPGDISPCNSCNGNDKWKAKEKTCETCKYIYAGDRPPCTLCNEDRDKWEAKDNG